MQLLQRNFLEDVFKEQKMQSMNDWYAIKPQEIKAHGGTKLLELYNDSILEMLKSVYPGK